MVGVDIIVNFAAETHVDRSILRPAPFVITNIVGTQVLLDAALKFKIKDLCIFQQMKCSEALTWKIRVSLMNEQIITLQVHIQPVKPDQTT